MYFPNLTHLFHLPVQPTMKQTIPVTKPVDVRFTDVSYQIPASVGLLSSLNPRADKPQPTNILNGISGYVAPGESLAILGPSGSGKTSFLNLLAARSAHPPSAGEILFAGKPRVARTKRHIGYVMQDDVFFSKLTVRETLEFTANIRIGGVSKEEKKQRIDSVMRRLRLTKCQHTRIGDQQFDKGISGGERKRVNIANELLHDPNLLLADECTSGLDSSSAFTVISLLRELCHEGRTVIATIHQPSSQMFSLFDKIMLLAAGKVAYFGRPTNVLSYFQSIDFPFPARAYNPADYMLELVIDDEVFDEGDLGTEKPTPGQSEGDEENPPEPSTQLLVLQGWEKHGPALLEANEKELKSSHNQFSPSPSLSTDLADATQTDESSFTDAPTEDDAEPDPQPPHNQLGRVRRALTKRFYDVTGRHSTRNMPEKYEVNWFNQVLVLGHRSLRQKRGMIIEPVYIVQVIAVTLISSLFWFQIDPVETSIEDRLGALSFFAIFWAFYSTFSALFAFPAERQVLNKDRAGGSYRLSAYYFAKTMVETPADMIYPTVFAVVVYYIIGLNPSFRSFILFIVILVLNVLTAQSVGLFVSAVMMDVRQGQVLASIWILGSMLISGYYIDPDNVPEFVEPIRAISFIKVSH